MAAKRKITKKLDKKKKKKWFSVFAPKNFGGAEIGESYVADSQNLIGKTIRVNLSNVARVRGNNIRIKFEITKVTEDKAQTEPIVYQMLSSHINRIVRKNRSKIDAALKLKTKDGVNVIIKPIIITRAKVKGGVLTATKQTAIELIEKEIAKSTFDSTLDSIIKYDFQKSIKNALKKVTPITAVEIKYFGKVTKK
jgi:small subunit ribosomal protein S3Ae